MNDPVRRIIPLKRRILYSVIIAVAFLVLMDVALSLVYGPAELRKAYREVVDTHLTDMSYTRFVERQRRIREARASLGMERGRSHPIYGWTYNPGFRLDDTEIEVHINSHAVRGEEFPLEKPPGEIRVLCLGGSTTAGEESRESETYPAQLQALLRRRFPSTGLRVINAGIPTYDLRRSLLLYELNQYRMEPDFVTIYHGINDLLSHRVGSVEIAAKRNYSGRPTMPFVYEGDVESHFVRESWHPLVQELSRHSHLTRLARAAAAAWRDAPALDAPDANGIETFGRFYRALVKEIGTRGVRAVPMTHALAWPGRFDDADRRKIEASFRIWLRPLRASAEVGRQIMDGQNEAILRLSRDEGLVACDLAAVVPPDRLHFTDVCHLTPEGNRVIAETMASTLAPLIEELMVRRRQGAPRTAG